MLATLLSVDGLVARIPNGAKLALPPDYSYCALAAVRALIRRGARDLHLVGVPAMGFQADMMIGAGCDGRSERVFGPEIDCMLGFALGLSQIPRGSSRKFEK